ncbi:uncharacterized protein LOC119732475 [Patiria miniata]|uniref:Uncharacterized protein n=1 Tax=Patiria miniata TaxID=46514 RepID=A0A914ADW4_PATMI|nr:uncharacterized protein LOC119732475 [Patiria miniata]
MDEALDELEDNKPNNEQPKVGISGRNNPPLGIAEDTPIDERNLKRIQELENEVKELRPLVEENQRLQRCVRGVKVVGRALQEAKKEVKLLRGQVKEDKGCDATMQPDGISTDGNEGAIQDSSYIMPYIMVPPNNDVISNVENTPTVAYLEEPRKIHLLGEKHCDQGADQDMGKCESFHKQKPVEIKADTGKTPEAKQTSESTIPSEDDNKAKTTAEAEQQTEDVAAVEDLFEELYPPSVKTTLHDVAASGVMKSVGTITDGGDTFLAKSRALHGQSDLQMQIKELKKVNLDWGKSYKQQKSTWMAQLEDKDKKIMELQKELENARPDAERKASQYDQMLLTAKTRIDKTEEHNKELQSQLDVERNRNDKSDQLSRNLAKQNQNMAEEIMRLKEALERKLQQKVKQSHSPPVEQPVNPLQSTSPETGKEGFPFPRAEANQKASQSPTPSPPAVTQGGAFAPLPLVAPADEVPAATRSKHGPPTPYTPYLHGDVPASAQKGAMEKQDRGITDKSYSKEELKEQVELLRQQNKMFHSDFNKENTEKIQAMEKLHNLQRELDKDKGRLQGYGHQDQPRKPASKFDDVVKSSKVKGPKQEVYKPPSDRVKPHKPHRKSEQKPAAKDNEMTVVQMGGKTTCKLTQPTAVIIHTEPEGQRLQINLLELGGRKQKSGKKRHEMEPFICPRCQRLYKGNEWESYEHHVTLCNV